MSDLNLKVNLPPRTPGWKTSEFWISLLSVLIPSLATALGATGHPALIAAGVAVSGVYTVGRTAVKVAEDVRAASVAKASLPAFGGMTEAERAARGASPGAH